MGVVFGRRADGTANQRGSWSTGARVWADVRRALESNDFTQTRRLMAPGELEQACTTLATATGKLEQAYTTQAGAGLLAVELKSGKIALQSPSFLHLTGQILSPQP